MQTLCAVWFPVLVMAGVSWRQVSPQDVWGPASREKFTGFVREPRGGCVPGDFPSCGMAIREGSVATNDSPGPLPDCELTRTTITPTQTIAAPKKMAATIVAVFPDSLNRGSFFPGYDGSFMIQSEILVLYFYLLDILQ
jgi:hypothetical protein